MRHACLMHQMGALPAAVGICCVRRMVTVVGLLCIIETAESPYVESGDASSRVKRRKTRVNNALMYVAVVHAMASAVM